MESSKQYTKSYKDTRGNIVREGDFVYILPDAFEEVRGRGRSFKKKIPYFKHPYGYVIASRDDALLVQTVKVIDNQLTPYENYRGLYGGRIMSISREGLVALTSQEADDILTRGYK